MRVGVAGHEQLLIQRKRGGGRRARTTIRGSWVPKSGAASVAADALEQAISVAACPDSSGRLCRRCHEGVCAPGSRGTWKQRPGPFGVTLGQREKRKVRRPQGARVSAMRLCNPAAPTAPPPVPRRPRAASAPARGPETSRCAVEERAAALSTASKRRSTWRRGFEGLRCSPAGRGQRFHPDCVSSIASHVASSWQMRRARRAGARVPREGAEAVCRRPYPLMWKACSYSPSYAGLSEAAVIASLWLASCSRDGTRYRRSPGRPFSQPRGVSMQRAAELA